jgi:hypothetical protein
VTAATVYFDDRAGANDKLLYMCCECNCRLHKKINIELSKKVIMVQRIKMKKKTLTLYMIKEQTCKCTLLDKTRYNIYRLYKLHETCCNLYHITNQQCLSDS